MSVDSMTTSVTITRDDGAQRVAVESPFDDAAAADPVLIHVAGSFRLCHIADSIEPD